MGYVYLISDNTENLYKIGVTRKNIDNRIKELQTGNPNELFLVRFHQTKYPFMLEKLLHNKFKLSNVKNEWFKLNVNEVLSFNDYCIDIENTIKTLSNNPFFNKKLR